MKAIILGLMLLSTSVSAGKLKDLYIKTVEDVEIKLMTEGYKILEITNVGFASEAQNSRCDYQMASKAVVVDSNVRLKAVVKEVKDLRGITKITLNVTLAIENEKKSAYNGNVVFLYHY